MPRSSTETMRKQFPDWATVVVVNMDPIEQVAVGSPTMVCASSCPILMYLPSRRPVAMRYMQWPRQSFGTEV